MAPLMPSNKCKNMERISEYQDERWKERARQIRELDGHKCALCGATGLLHVHHLSYPPAPYHLWDSTDNELVTLCPECHKKVHESSTRPYLDEERHLCNYIDEEQERLAQEAYEMADMFKEEYIKALCSSRACCALCSKSIYHWDHLDCRVRIEDDRDFTDVEPSYWCEEFENPNLIQVPVKPKNKKLSNVKLPDGFHFTIDPNKAKITSWTK